MLASVNTLTVNTPPKVLPYKTNNTKLFLKAFMTKWEEQHLYIKLLDMFVLVHMDSATT